MGTLKQVREHLLYSNSRVMLLHHTVNTSKHYLLLHRRAHKIWERGEKWFLSWLDYTLGDAFSRITRVSSWFDDTIPHLLHTHKKKTRHIILSLG